MNSDKILFKLHAEVCNAMGHPIRLETVSILKNQKELSFGDIADAIGVNKSTLARHLALMVNNGILLQRKDGVQVFYRIASPKIPKACGLMREVLLERLKNSMDILTTVNNN